MHWPSKSWHNPIIHPTTMSEQIFLRSMVYDIKFKYAQDWHL